MVCLLAIFGLYWLIIASYGVYLCLKMFRKYSAYLPLPNSDPKWQGFIRTDYRSWDHSKILLGCFLRLPLRVLVFMGYIFGCIGILFVQSKVGLGPAMRKVVNSYLQLSRVLFSLIGISIQHDGARLSVETPIVIANHTNFFDIYALLLGVGPLSFMAKREIQKYPIFGACADGLFCLYVDRDSPDSRQKLLDEIKQRTAIYSPSASNLYPLVIFPEGTTSNGTVLLPFKIGAFDSLAPITAFHIRYQSICGLGMDEISQLDCALLLFASSVSITVTKMTLQPFEQENSEEYMERCRNALAEKAKLTKVEGGFRDKMVLQAYRKEQSHKNKSS